MSASSGLSVSRSSNICRIASTSSGGNCISGSIASSSVTAARVPSAAGHHRSNIAS